MTTGKEVVKYEPQTAPKWDIFNNEQLLALYGQVLRVYARHSTFIDFDPDEEEYNLAKRMRQELVRRVGDKWLTKWHQA